MFDKSDEPINCPHCKVSLLGQKIPDKDKKYFAGNYFKREIGIYDFNKDRTVKFICPDCKKEWI